MKNKLVKSMNMSDIVKAKMLADERRDKEALYEQGKLDLDVYNESQSIDSRYSKIKYVEDSQSKYYKFSKSVKDMLLSEALNNIYLKAIPVKEIDKLSNTSYMDQYIQETGCDNLLSRFKSKTVILSEISRLVNLYHSLIMEKVDKDDKDTHTVDQKIKDEFIEKIDNAEADKISSIIKDRVQDGLEKFVKDTADDNEQVKDIIMKNKEDKGMDIVEPSDINVEEDDTSDTPNTDTEDEPDTTPDTVENNSTEEEDIEDEPEQIDKNEDIKEESVNLAEFNRKINNIRANRCKTVFEMMVIEISKKTLTDKTIMESVEGRPSIEFIIENTLPMYTFLEMLNTMKIDCIDETYIYNLYQDIKK